MSGTKRIKVTFRGRTGLVAHHTERPEEILDPGRLAGTPDQVLLFRARAESDAKGEQFEGGRRMGMAWEATDGSKVVAEEVKSVTAPGSPATPWQLFKVTQHIGEGRFEDVTWIQRINTDAKGATFVFYGPKH